MAKNRLLDFLKKPIVKGLIKSIPFIGDIADNVLTETNTSPAGEVDKGDLITKVIRLALLVGLLYLVFSGKLNMEDAEGYKEFIN